MHSMSDGYLYLDRKNKQTNKLFTFHVRVTKSVVDESVVDGRSIEYWECCIWCGISCDRWLSSSELTDFRDPWVGRSDIDDEIAVDDDI